MAATLEKTSQALFQLNCSFCGENLGLYIPQEEMEIYGAIVACEEDYCIIKWQEIFGDKFL
jgi:hypothetical protein